MDSTQDAPKRTSVIVNIVALDTATEACSVALMCNGDVQFRYQVAAKIHAKVLLPMLDELMAEAQLNPSQLDAVAFGRGPGGFTGVRIATAAAQAIALGVDIPAAPVSTLAAIATRARRETNQQKIAVAIDARMGEVYWGAYLADSIEPVLMGEETVCSPDHVALLDSKWVAAGTGWQTYPEQLIAASGATVVDGVDPFPHAVDILSIGAEIIEQGRGVDAEMALPVYLRDNVARTEAERAKG